MKPDIPTVDRARGRWREILPKLGVDERFLTARKGPCPVCGGKDRFRFDDRSEGWFFCQQCGPGPGLVLLRKLNGWDYKTACCEVDEVIGTECRPRPATPRPDGPDARKLAAIRRLLADADAPAAVAAFLVSKRLSVSSAVLRGHRACPCYDATTRKLVGHFPALIAPILSPSGCLVSAQRLYLTDALAPDDRKKNMPPVTPGALMGAAVRLHEADDELGIAEGVTTALAAFQLFGVRTWAALSANGLKAFKPPPGVQRLTIFADNDANATGQLAAYDLVRRLHGTVETIVKIPDEPDTDWHDVLTERRPA